MRILILLLVYLSFYTSVSAEPCKNQNEICVDGAGTRTIDGIRVYRDCWRYQYIKECLTDAENNCAEIPVNECNLKHEECTLNIQEGGKDYCAKVRKDYDCQSTITYQEQRTEVIMYPDNGDATQSLLCSAFCLDSNCDAVTKAKQHANDEMAASIGQLQMLSDVKKGLVDKNNSQFDIFKGQDRRCHKKVLSYSNCCNNSGWAKSIGVVSCSKEQVALAELQKQGKCVALGEYCSSKKLGICIIKTKSYCCYPNVLSKNIQTGSREQLGKSFGSAEHPSCSGFTLEELEKIDFSKIDFSEFWSKEVAPRLKDYNSEHNQILIENSFPKLDKTGLNKQILTETP